MYRKPRYPSDSDYTTNAPSYYDDLARKNELIKYLSKRIWEYDKTLYERLEDIEDVLSQVIHKIGEGFNEEIQVLLVQWVEDGTLDHIINETLMNQKADISYVDGIKLQIQNEINSIHSEINSIHSDVDQLQLEKDQIGTTIFVRV